MRNITTSGWTCVLGLLAFMWGSCGGGGVSGSQVLDVGAEDGAIQMQDGFEGTLEVEVTLEDGVWSQDDASMGGGDDFQTDAWDEASQDGDGFDDSASFECTSIAECDDQNGCTLDLCVDNRCIHECLNGLACGSDGGVARCSLEGEECACVKMPECENDEQCNDQDPCTKDICAQNQCVHTCDVGAVCSDGNPMTSMDSCVIEGGSCLCKGVLQACTDAKDCDDGNACTLDNCVDGKCINDCQVGAACDDKDPYTDNDTCRETPSGCVCQGKRECYSNNDCVDMNPCTVDYCDGQGKCRHNCYQGLSCSDGNPATQNDVCVLQGSACVCVGTPVMCIDDKDCDDLNPCTNDACVSGVCEHQCSINSVCDDGDIWTNNDKCVIGPSGACTCQGERAECLDARDCHDQNPCTEDTCISFTCHHTCLEGTSCDDGNPDTRDDRCVWEQSPAPSCLCRGRFECTQDKDCDDQNPCTIDKCQNTHCYHECSIGQGCQGDWPLPVQGYCVTSDGNCACVAPWVVCDDPFDCPPSQFCYKDEKMCGSLGVCKDRPSPCPLIYKPVCGCDGKTYSNSCEAYQAGTSVWYEGECALTHCFANSMCPQDQYCSFVPCAIETGVCIPRPEICLHEDDPVCGCDNKTYQNACEAGRAGVSINYSGACKQCIFDTDCNDGNPCTRDYCYQSKCEYGCQTGEVCLIPGLPGAGMCVLDASGCRCEVTPECITNLDCNDSNQCTTDLCIDGKCQYKCNVGSKCSIELPIPVEGTCQEQLGSCVCSPSAKPCNSNLDCSTSEYCQFQAGTCAPPGTCVQRPLMCPDVFDPVCGCDGITYNNACEAARAGVSIKHQGECEGVPQCRTDADCNDSNQCTTDACVAGVCEHKCDVGQKCIVQGPIPVEGKCQEEFGACGCLPEGVQACASNADCFENQYCQFQPGTCAPPGACIQKPSMCPLIYDPVCGCDGRTYDNACLAARAGVSIRYLGACEIGPM